MSILEQLKQPMLAVLGVVLIVAAVIGVGLVAEHLACTTLKGCLTVIDELTTIENLLSVINYY